MMVSDSEYGEYVTFRSECYATRQTDISGKTYHVVVTCLEGPSTVSWIAKYGPTMDSNSCPSDQDAFVLPASWYRFSGSRQAYLQLLHIPLDDRIEQQGVLDCLL